MPLTVALVLGVLLPDAARATPVPPAIADSPADYRGFVNGRFLLLNMHGGLSHRDIELARENVRYAAWMNAGVIRVFATDSAQEDLEDGEWVGPRRFDNRRGLTSYGPNRDGSGSCYPPAGQEPGARCRIEAVLRNLPAMP